MPTLQFSNKRGHSKRRLALEVLESRLTLDRSWFEASQLPLLVDGTTSTVADINVNATLTVADIDLRVNLDHAQPNELNLTLISPAGTEIRMVTGQGGDGTGFHDNIIDDSFDFRGEIHRVLPGRRSIETAQPGRRAPATWTDRSQTCPGFRAPRELPAADQAQECPRRRLPRPTRPRSWPREMRSLRLRVPG
ncbi:MAG: proprotein convertase P-domain-containing protein, partial [Gemmataceae bacterium]